MAKNFRQLSLSRVLIAALALVSLYPLSSSAEATGEQNSVQYANMLSHAFEAAADKITPSVVNVSFSKKRQSRRTGMPKDPFFEQFKDFFGEDFAFRFGIPNDGGDTPAEQGLGTGVIVDSRGYILTNNHVIGDADVVDVKTQDGKNYKAEIIGKDERTDLAVIKIKSSNLVPATLGNSDKLNIGEWVVAAGNPFGLDNTITAGIVSAKSRSIMGGGQYEDFIQTDAAINPGNSGGPLVNLQGEVVGINTAIFSRSGGYMGIGFAIPINLAKGIMNSLIENGKVVRGWLGVGIQNLTEELSTSFEYSGTEGALVGHVDPSGPAAKAGIKQGDIIVGLGEEKIKDINQLRNKVADLRPGSSVKIEYVRDGRKDSVTAKVGELPAQKGAERDRDQEEEEPTSNIGVSVKDLTPDIARRIGSVTKHGAVVAAVRPGSIAASAGVQPMDIIISVQRTKIDSAADFKEAMRKVDLKKGVRLTVETQGMERFVILRDSDE